MPISEGSIVYEHTALQVFTNFVYMRVQILAQPSRKNKIIQAVTSQSAANQKSMSHHIDKMS